MIPDRTTARTVDWQKIRSAGYRRLEVFCDWDCRVQEILGDDEGDSGRIPRTVEVELTDSLVDCCVPVRSTV